MIEKVTKTALNSCVYARWSPEFHAETAQTLEVAGSLYHTFSLDKDLLEPPTPLALLTLVCPGELFKLCHMQKDRINSTSQATGKSEWLCFLYCESAPYPQVPRSKNLFKPWRRKMLKVQDCKYLSENIIKLILYIKRFRAFSCFSGLKGDRLTQSA